MHRFASLILVFNAAVIGLVGFAYLLDPNFLLGNYGLMVTEPGMDNMLRASYGGVFVILAGLWAWGGLQKSRRTDMLALLSLLMGSLALGRIVSLLAVGQPGDAINMLLGYELFVCLLAGGLWWKVSWDK